MKTAVRTGKLPLSFPPVPEALTAADRLVIGRELVKAQDAINRAFKIAVAAKDMPLAKSLGDQVRTIGAQITALHGGPVKLDIAELL